MSLRRRQFQPEARLRKILVHADAVRQQAGEDVFGARIALFGGFAYPGGALGFLLFHTGPAEDEEFAEEGLAERIVVGCCLGRPAPRFLFAAYLGRIQMGQGEQPLVLPGGQAQPFEGLLRVAPGGTAGEVGQAEQGLRLGVVLVCGAGQPGEGLLRFAAQ